ncbi:hypothetical protein AX13_05075 [Comamonas aquatica DA1877]|uniref:Uncharacterized protein n=1 Tax=Comamonas aquatica DA1877 TaxID=1457173 RepID=A0A014P008_9BURK|nr:hypothetical protein AX13_05075 [Comamonas aquatica DA1877]
MILPQLAQTQILEIGKFKSSLTDLIHQILAIS